MSSGYVMVQCMAWTPLLLTGHHSEITACRPSDGKLQPTGANCQGRAEPNIWSIMGVSKTNYPEPVINDDAHADPLGFLIVYVDDILLCWTPQCGEGLFGPNSR